MNIEGEFFFYLNHNFLDNIKNFCNKVQFQILERLEKHVTHIFLSNDFKKMDFVFYLNFVQQQIRKQNNTNNKRETIKQKSLVVKV